MFPEGDMSEQLNTALIEGLLTPEEVCQLLKIKRSYLYDLTHRNQIPYLKLGRHLRFRRCEIASWLEGKRIEAVPGTAVELLGS
jgi:excisionase family DNA binding protein